MNYIITTNLGHLKIFQIEKDINQTTPTLRVVEEKIFPEAHSHYDDLVTDQAGRFPVSDGSNSGAMSIGQENDFELEMKRRLIDQIVIKIESFLQTHPQAHWGLAASAPIDKLVVERLSPIYKATLQKNLEKDLTKLPPREILVSFKKGN